MYNKYINCKFHIVTNSFNYEIPIVDIAVVVAKLILHSWKFKIYSWWHCWNNTLVMSLETEKDEINVHFALNCSCEYTTLVSGRSPSVRPAARATHLSSFYFFVHRLMFCPRFFNWLIYIFIPWVHKTSFLFEEMTKALKGT